MKNIYVLVGYMGCGKTTFGKKFAKALNFDFIDLDGYIEDYTKKSITDIFAIDGEETFRKIETECLHKIIDNNDNLVLACGGGTPCFNNNMDYINSNCHSLYIQTSFINLVNNITNDKFTKRPLLDKLNYIELLSKVSKDIQEREKFYIQANVTLISDKLNTLF